MKGLMRTFRPETSFRRGEVLLLVGQLAALALLLAHAARYRFLTDDAFISFRYARNLVEGHGLVFNPGMPPVEGYTNFLWVLMLAACSALGASPEAAAPVLTIALTIVLWWLVAEFAAREAPPDRPWLGLIAPFLLAATRSVAVWSTGGLETRLFEVLVVAGTLRFVTEVRAVLRRKPAPPPVASGLFALAALTRPDAILLFAGAMTAAAGALARHGRLDLRRFLRGPALFAAVVAAHFVFRRLYYGDWLPNTFYAKVNGFRWDLGWTYHAALFVEYFGWLWLPLVVAGVVRHVRRGTGWMPALFGAVVVPQMIWVAAIGGDHFEYRPQDLWFPFAFLLVGEGIAAFPAVRRGTIGAIAAALVVAGGLFVIPDASHRQFPSRYLAGFPGWETALTEGKTYLHPDRSAVLWLPGLRRLAELHRNLLRTVTRSFVGIRQEEHRAFLAMVMPEAERLRAMVHDGLIPADAVFGLDSVGAIPYVSDLLVIDRLGLTDREVARSGAISSDRLVAHERRATWDYAKRSGADFWAFDSVHALFRADDPALASLVSEAREHRVPVFRADAGEGWVMLGLFPQGEEAGRARFPRLHFESVLDGE